MKRNEAVFLTAVVVFGLVLAVVSLSRFGEVMSVGTGAPASGEGVSGKARDVDLGKIRSLIQRGYLSDREAVFFKKAPAVPDPAEEPGFSPKVFSSPDDPGGALPGSGVIPSGDGQD